MGDRIVAGKRPVAICKQPPERRFVLCNEGRECLIVVGDRTRPSLDPLRRGAERAAAALDSNASAGSPVARDHGASVATEPSALTDRPRPTRVDVAEGPPSGRC
jgi:hypothetical protein